MSRMMLSGNFGRTLKHKPMTTRNKQQLLFIIFSLICLLVQSILVNAQTPHKKKYKGFEVSFASRAFTVDSDIAKINGVAASHAGGMVGLVYGGEALRATLGFGYYSSVGKIAGTIDLFEAALATYFYPLGLLSRNSSRLQPYLTAGIAQNSFRMYGYYINKEPGVTNYSQAEAPYLGAIQQVNGSAGAGVDFKLLDAYDFIHVFAEVSQGYAMASNSTSTSFQHTDINHGLLMQVGIRFGANR